MKLNKEKCVMAFKTALFFSVSMAFAAADTSLVQKQEETIAALDSINSSVLGLRLGGTGKAGVLSSKLDADHLDATSPSRDNQAFTDVNLTLDARPSKETNVHVELRLHKDWQNAYEEAVNPAIGHWFSYDGRILNRHVGFNLGYMRIGYTPLTIFTPQVNILQEPEIFAERRVEALAERNLDTTSRRLLQGLNVDYHSGAVGPLSDIYVQATGARLRAIAKKYDQLFFDFDWSDRYLAAGRLGLAAMGINVGANYVYVFDRIRSTRAVAGPNPLDAFYYNDNSVFSVDAGIDSKELLSSLPVSFGVQGEFAMSNWRDRMDTLVSKTEVEYSMYQAVNYNEGAYSETFYVRKSEKTSKDYELETLSEDDGKAWNVKPFVRGALGSFEFTLEGIYLQNDEDFWSEPASTPSYQGNTSILNPDAFYDNSVTPVDLFRSFRSGNLENLYFSVYNTNVLSQKNMMSSDAAIILDSDPTKESSYIKSRLFNNYRLGHFYRNGYNAEIWERGDLDAASLDPSVNMALPFGLATPDRKGFTLSFDAKFNDFVSLNARYGQIEQQSVDLSYTQMAFGLGFDLARLIGYSKDLLLQGSFEQQTSDGLMEVETNRIIAGFNVGIYGPVAFRGGFQMLTKDLGKDNFISVTYDDGGNMVNAFGVSNVEEMLILAGPRVKLASMAYLTLQGGLLSNKITYFDATLQTSDLTMDKLLLMADVTVNF
jgi:hypothetical protein